MEKERMRLKTNTLKGVCPCVGVVARVHVSIQDSVLKKEISNILY